MRALHHGYYQTKQHASEGQRVKWMKDCYPLLTQVEQTHSGKHEKAPQEGTVKCS